MTESTNSDRLPQVSFYHLQSGNTRGIHLFCCRLAEKAWQLGNTVGILTPGGRESQLVDDLLWTWRDDAFLPHAISDGKPDPQTPVMIADDLGSLQHCSLLINLQQQVPGELEQYRRGFERIAEIIDEDTTTKQQGRIRYSWYDRNSYPLEYHEIS